MSHSTTLQYAQQLDAADPLRSLRDNFLFPQHNGQPVMYFCGNSLGLQPKKARTYLDSELNNWAENAVEGHFRGEMPWKKYHHFFKGKLAAIVGAQPAEVTVMNGLTVNLHLMMVSFFRPQGKRTKIVMEAGAFPSDQYAVETQLNFHGLDYNEHVIEVAPRDGEHTLRTEDILNAIAQHKDEIALVMFSGVNYYTGQYYDIPAITKAAHEAGAFAGFDLAHTVGNIPVQLHDWDVDFAVWCSYKYLNAGPGATAGVFVHERHGNNPQGMPRFAGWWGYEESTRFQMRRGYIPMEGADGWQMSNAPVMGMAPLMASLDLYEQAGMEALRKKGLALSSYLIFLLKSLQQEGLAFTILTPETDNDRGCQVSILTGDNGKALHESITQQGVIADWREPNVIRVAPVPMYNSFEDVWRFYHLMQTFK